MHIFRGPKEINFSDKRHELVDTVSSETLKESIAANKPFEFNISKKDAFDRKSICTAIFEDDDIVPIVNGVISKLKIGEEKLKRIHSIVYHSDFEDNQKIALIKEVLLKVRI